MRLVKALLLGTIVGLAVAGLAHFVPVDWRTIFAGIVSGIVTGVALTQARSQKDAERLIDRVPSDLVAPTVVSLLYLEYCIRLCEISEVGGLMPWALLVPAAVCVVLLIFNWRGVRLPGLDLNGREVRVICGPGIRRYAKEVATKLAGGITLADLSRETGINSGLLEKLAEYHRREL